MTPFGSLRGRLIAASVVWLAVALAAGGTVLRFAFQDSVERAFQDNLTATLRSLAAAIEVTPEGLVRLSRPLGDPRFDQAYSGWYWQVSNGAALARSRSLWDVDLPVGSGSEPGVIHYGAGTGPRGERLMTAERDLTFPAFAEPVHVTIAASRAGIEDEIGRFDRLLLASFLALGIGLVAAVGVQVGFGLRPLRRLATELESLRGRAEARLGGPYPAEVAPLAEALNAVLDHDSKLVERARAHVGNLAHGLKTPLAVLKAEMDSGRPDPAAVNAQIERMTRLIEHQLARAHAEANIAPALAGRIPMAPVIDEIAAMLRKVNAHRALALSAECAPGATFAGDREDLAEIVGNLTENACKWARGTVLVTADGVALTVEDDGPGLTPGQCAEATRRGARLDEAAPGHGLGLAIVRDLAHLHGGRLELDRSPLGGLRARVVFRDPQ